MKTQQKALLALFTLAFSAPASARAAAGDPKPTAAATAAVADKTDATR